MISCFFRFVFLWWLSECLIYSRIIFCILISVDLGLRLRAGSTPSLVCIFGPLAWRTTLCLITRSVLFFISIIVAAVLVLGTFIDSSGLLCRVISFIMILFATLLLALFVLVVAVFPSFISRLIASYLLASLVPVILSISIAILLLSISTLRVCFLLGAATKQGRQNCSK